jgi:hypothetical protein
MFIMQCIGITSNAMLRCTLALSSSKVQYGTSWMQKTLLTRRARDRSTGNPREELRMYLESPLEAVENVVAWWGVSYHLF